jgi:molybdopterin molybdotransferase
MTEFLRLVQPDEARHLLLSHIRAPLQDAETVATPMALSRVTDQPVTAPHALPEFPRSTVDGYAVRARDTFGALPAQPAYLELAGEVLMGRATDVKVGRGQCALIHTGGMLPGGADAVVMLEHVQIETGGVEMAPAREIEVLRAAAPGENVISVGEDVQQGQVVLPGGTVLRPPEIGGLMALGLTTISVTRKPVVALISSGDEIVEPHGKPSPGQVRDVNASALAALVTQAGGLPDFRGIVPDEPGRAETAAREALTTSDAIVITAGSSASTRDLTVSAIAALGAPGVLVHGINIRPGKPTILGVCDGKAVIGLPGNPVSALVIARLFLVPVIQRLLGIANEGPRPTVQARLTVNVASQAGREDWWGVRLLRAQENEGLWEAEPIFGRSNLIFNLAAAYGLLRIPVDQNGLSAGEFVEIEPL